MGYEKLGDWVSKVLGKPITRREATKTIVQAPGDVKAVLGKLSPEGQQAKEFLYRHLQQDNPDWNEGGIDFAEGMPTSLARRAWAHEDKPMTGKAKTKWIQDFVKWQQTIDPDSSSVGTLVSEKDLQVAAEMALGNKTYMAESYLANKAADALRLDKSEFMNGYRAWLREQMDAIWGAPRDALEKQTQAAARGEFGQHLRAAFKGYEPTLGNKFREKWNLAKLTPEEEAETLRTFGTPLAGFNWDKSGRYIPAPKQYYEQIKKVMDIVPAAAEKAGKIAGKTIEKVGEQEVTRRQLFGLPKGSLKAGVPMALGTGGLTQLPGTEQAGTGEADPYGLQAKWNALRDKALSYYRGTPQEALMPYLYPQTLPEALTMGMPMPGAVAGPTIALRNLRPRFPGRIETFGGASQAAPANAVRASMMQDFLNKEVAKSGAGQPQFYYHVSPYMREIIESGLIKGRAPSTSGGFGGGGGTGVSMAGTPEVARNMYIELLRRVNFLRQGPEIFPELAAGKPSLVYDWLKEDYPRYLQTQNKPILSGGFGVPVFDALEKKTISPTEFQHRMLAGIPESARLGMADIIRRETEFVKDGIKTPIEAMNSIHQNYLKLRTRVLNERLPDPTLLGTGADYVSINPENLGIIAVPRNRIGSLPAETGTDFFNQEIKFLQDVPIEGGRAFGSEALIARLRKVLGQ